MLGSHCSFELEPDCDRIISLESRTAQNHVTWSTTKLSFSGSTLNIRVKQYYESKNRSNYGYNE
jgi:hypothetical protein